jgi:hypothetical protein
MNTIISKLSKRIAMGEFRAKKNFELLRDLVIENDIKFKIGKNSTYTNDGKTEPITAIEYDKERDIFVMKLEHRELHIGKSICDFNMVLQLMKFIIEGAKLLEEQQ